MLLSRMPRLAVGIRVCRNGQNRHLLISKMPYLAQDLIKSGQDIPSLDFICSPGWDNVPRLNRLPSFLPLFDGPSMPIHTVPGGVPVPVYRHVHRKVYL